MSAETFAEILNSFVEPISYKAMVGRLAPAAPLESPANRDGCVRHRSMCAQIFIGLGIVVTVVITNFAFTLANGNRQPAPTPAPPPMILSAPNPYATYGYSASMPNLLPSSSGSMPSAMPMVRGCH